MLILGYRIFFIVILLSHGSFHKHFQQASPYPEVTEPTGTACMHVRSLQLCPALCNPMDCSLPGSSVHGILQERILEWVAMSFSGTADIATFSLILFCLCGKQNSALAEEGRYPGIALGKWVGSRLKGLNKKTGRSSTPHWSALRSYPVWELLARPRGSPAPQHRLNARPESSLHTAQSICLRVSAAISNS